MNVEHKQAEVKLEEEVNNNKTKSNKGPYVLGEKLGEGAFAKVRLATQIHIKEKCAVKILEKKFLESSRDIQRLKKEIKILKKIRHKNIIQLYDIMESKRNLYFVMEYCKNGELFDYIVKKKRLKEPEACCFFQQIIDGVDYLHNQGIIHRDLKPENLLLDDNNHIKISDFGLSTFYSKNNYLQTACGTPSYAPPEMLEGHEYNGEATDVWSCGIILYAMLCGTLPFSESQEEIIVKKIKTHDYSIPNYLSHEAKDLLSHILIIDPKERINISQIKQHSWFNLVKPHLMRGINLEEDIIPIDDKILEMVKNYGFDPEECRTLLLKNKFCSLTTIYYLCLKKYVRENGKSISDLESDLYEEYINNPKNKIQKNKNKEEKEKEKEEKKEEKNKNNNNNVKTERENTPNITLSLKKLNTNKTDRNNIFSMKRNGTPTLNYIKISKEKRNLKSSKNITKGYVLSENANHNKQVINYNKKKNSSKENETSQEKESLKINEINRNNNNITKVRESIHEKNKKNIKDSKNNEVKTETKIKYVVSKNNSIIKNTISNKNNVKKININKNDISKTSMNESETKNNSINKKKIKDLNNNNNNKVKKSIIKVSKPKPLRHETEKKTLTTKFLLNKDDNSKMKNNNSINANVNIINININNNNSSNNFNGNLSNKNSSSLQTISDKEISFIIKQKLKQMNHKKCDEKNQNQNESKKKDNSFKILKEEEEELKALLNPLYLKDLNISNSQSNTIGSIMNNTNSSHLFSSIFQDSIPNQTKTFIGKPQNYSLKTENNVNDVSRPKSSLFQYLGNDIEKYMLIHGEKPINVINFIAKKLVASSFCGSLNLNSGFNSSYVNNNNNNLINQTNSFFKERTESNNSLTKSNGNVEIKIENNSFDNSKDTSLFINDDNTNDDKDYNFKNLVSILNKKFKGYISQEKLNKSEVANKNSVIENKIIKNSTTINKEDINGSINKIKKHENKNNLIGSFNQHIDNQNNNNNQNNKINSYLLFSYSKNANSKAKKIIQKNKTNVEKIDKASTVFPTPKMSTFNISNTNSHYNTFLDISTNYEPGFDSRNSSVEKSTSLKKNPLRNFSCSPSHYNKEEKNIGHIHKIYNNKNTTFNRVMNLTKRNRNFNTISEDEEFRDFDRNKAIKKGRKYPIYQNKVTIDLCADEKINSSCNNRTSSKIKTKITKKK